MTIGLCPNIKSIKIENFLISLIAYEKRHPQTFSNISLSFGLSITLKWHAKNSNFHREVFLFFHEVFLRKIIVIIIIMKQMDSVRHISSICRFFWTFFNVFIPTKGSFSAVELST